MRTKDDDSSLLLGQNEVVSFGQFAEYMERVGKPLDPRQASVLRDMRWGPYQPTRSEWSMLLGTLKMAEECRVERERPPVVRTFRDGCEVFRVRKWEDAAQVALLARVQAVTKPADKIASPEPAIVHEFRYWEGYTAFLVRLAPKYYVVVEHDEEGSVYAIGDDAAPLRRRQAKTSKLRDQIIEESMLRGAQVWTSRKSAIADFRQTRAHMVAERERHAAAKAKKAAFRVVT